MTKSALQKVLTAAKSRLSVLESELVSAEEFVGSVQLRYGMVLSGVKSALAERDDSGTFKEWTAKNSKRSYSTLNRWANSGTVALLVGFSDDSETVPPVSKVEPGFRFIRDARTPEKYSEGVAELEKWWTAVSDKSTTDAIARAEKLRPSKANTGNTRNTPTDDNTDNSVTVTLDPAELEAAVAAVVSVLKSYDSALKKKHGAEWYDTNKATVYAIRSSMLRLIGEHDPTAIAVALNS